MVCESENCKISKFDIASYESNDVVWQNIVLTDEQNFPKLTTIRKPLLDAIEKEIITYFPDLDYKDFDIFLPE